MLGIIRRVRDWLIKMLGGYTEDDIKAIPPPVEYHVERRDVVPLKVRLVYDSDKFLVDGVDGKAWAEGSRIRSEVMNMLAKELVKYVEAEYSYDCIANKYIVRASVSVVGPVKGGARYE